MPAVNADRIADIAAGEGKAVHHIVKGAALSFTVPILLPKTGGRLDHLNVAPNDVTCMVRLGMEPDLDRVKETRFQSACPYKPVTLTLHSGLLLHRRGGAERSATMTSASRCRVIMCGSTAPNPALVRVQCAAAAAQCVSAGGALGGATLRISGTIVVATTKQPKMIRKASAKV